MDEINYLVSHFLTGENLTQPLGWNETLQKLRSKTCFDNTGDQLDTSFGKIFSQVSREGGSSANVIKIQYNKIYL